MVHHLRLDVMEKETFLKSYSTLSYGTEGKWFAVMTPDQRVCALGLKTFPNVQDLLKRYDKMKLLETSLSLEDPLSCLLVGTPFQHQVWKALLDIPYGQTWSYQQLAAYLHHSKAVRAVANAVAANPISPLIPCHRVIHSTGRLGGYFWGAEAKAQLLQQEGWMSREP